MKYEVNFGQPVAAASVDSSSAETFRIAVLGDLAGRSNSGQLGIGDDLAARKAHRVDVDNLDEVISRFGIKLALPIANDGGIVTVDITCMDDFHPDELYERLPVFEKLASLRGRLQNSSSFEAAAKVVKSLLGQSAIDQHQHRRRKSRGTSVPNRKLNDFESLVSQPDRPADETPIVDLLKQVVGSCSVADPDPQQDQLVAAVDAAIAETMRQVLHHPDFQAMESLWRSIELLVRRLETSSQLELVLYDVTAEELAADLSGSDQLEQSGLYRLLVEQPSLDAMQGPLSAILGSYTFESSPPHADLLGRMSRIAAAAHAPFIASIGNQVLPTKSSEPPHPMVKQSWDALRSLPTTAYLMLTVPKFMLRWPYGSKTDPIDAFEFEEFTNQGGVSSMLWANSCFLAGLLLGQTFLQQGRASMKLGSLMTLDDMPFYYYVDQYGDQVALPCTNRLLSESMAADVLSRNLAPVLGIKGRPEVRLGSFNSLAGVQLCGPWVDRIDATAAPSTAPPVVSGVVDEPVSDAEDDPSAELDELDAMLDEIGDAEPPESTEAPADDATTEEPTEADSGDSELDELEALLGMLDEPAASAGDDEMDPDLAALLDEL